MLVLLSSVLFIQAPACARTCYVNAEAFMVATYGSAYRDDDNLVIRIERHGRQDYYVASDGTSGTNAPLMLLMPTPGKGLCAVLSTPPVASLKARKLDGRGRPTVFLAKEQGATAHDITYVWDGVSGTFKPRHCKRITWTGNRAVATVVHCASLLAR